MQNSLPAAAADLVADHVASAALIMCGLAASYASAAFRPAASRPSLALSAAAAEASLAFSVAAFRPSSALLYHWVCSLAAPTWAPPTSASAGLAAQAPIVQIAKLQK